MNWFVLVIYIITGLSAFCSVSTEIAKDSTLYQQDTNAKKAIEILQREQGIDGPFTVDFLSGGLSGSSIIKVNASGSDYVVRFWNQQWKEYFPQDLVCQVIASDAGYGPQIFFTDEIDCVTAMAYLQREDVPEIKLRLQAMVELLKKMHTGPEVPHGIDKAGDLDESIEVVRKMNPLFLDLNVIQAVQSSVFAVTRRNASKVPCHRDLHPGNLIFTQDRFVAIDYTWGGMDDPYVDLAIIAIFNCMTLEEEELLLRFYLGRNPTLAEIARLSLMKLPAKIFYGLEFLKLAPASALSSTVMPIVKSKNYMKFGLHGEVQETSTDFLEYAVSMLGEVLDYSHSKRYDEALALLSINESENE